MNLRGVFILPKNLVAFQQQAGLSFIREQWTGLVALKYLKVLGDFRVWNTVLLLRVLMGAAGTGLFCFFPLHKCYGRLGKGLLNVAGVLRCLNFDMGTNWAWFEEVLLICGFQKVKSSCAFSPANAAEVLRGKKWRVNQVLPPQPRPQPGASGSPFWVLLLYPKHSATPPWDITEIT